MRLDVTVTSVPLDNESVRLVLGTIADNLDDQKAAYVTVRFYNGASATSYDPLKIPKSVSELGVKSYDDYSLNLTRDELLAFR